MLEWRVLPSHSQEHTGQGLRGQRSLGKQNESCSRPCYSDPVDPMKSWQDVVYTEEELEEEEAGPALLQ